MSEENSDSAPAPQQPELPLPFPELSGDQPLLPARMINEYQYCPRLAYLEWVQGEWADSADTEDGRRKHKQVDQRKGKLPPPGEAEQQETLHSRSIELSSNRLGLIARLDLIEAQDGAVLPVDYKRGKRPHVERGVYDPERVQLCVQGLLLEEQGYECREGVIYYVAGRERVRVPFDEELRSLTHNAIAGLRHIAIGGQIPPPLEDSPKCPRCALVGVCLPDELAFLRAAAGQPRPMAVPRAEAMPLYVQAHHAKISKKGDTLQVSIDDKIEKTARMGEISQVVILGNVYLTAPALNALMREQIPVSWHSFGGWFVGHTIGLGHKNVELRTAQYRASFDDQRCLRLARGLVRNKILNCRTLLRRNWRGELPPDRLLAELQNDAEASRHARDLQELLGIEGAAASRYFGAFRQLLRQPDSDQPELPFDFQARNRRPPKDPINALLSYAYAVLSRQFHVTLTAVGFDPHRGFYHQPRYGRPALALDLMEPFRPIIADSVVIRAVNNGEVRPSDFLNVGGAVALTSDGRKRFLGALEARLNEPVTHPLFGYRAEYRRILELQARLLGRHLLDEIPEYPEFRTR